MTTPTPNEIPSQIKTEQKNRAREITPRTRPYHDRRPAFQPETIAVQKLEDQRIYWLLLGDTQRRSLGPRKIVIEVELRVAHPLPNATL